MIALDNSEQRPGSWSGSWYGEFSGHFHGTGTELHPGLRQATSFSGLFDAKVDGGDEVVEGQQEKPKPNSDSQTGKPSA